MGRRSRRLLCWGMAMVAVVLQSAGCSRGPVALKSGECKSGSPLAGVYHPSRLTVKQDCVTVTGIVDCLKDEPDGDIHVRLRPDPEFAKLLRPTNAVQQCTDQVDPHLVVEIIPQKAAFPHDENAADIGGFITPAAPAVGDRITVTGPYVWDSNILHDLLRPGEDSNNWAEIHPAWNITVDQHTTSVAAADNYGPDIGD